MRSRTSLQSLIGAGSSIRLRIAEWLDQKSTARLLASLNDHALADIGLTRADVDENALQQRAAEKELRQACACCS